LLKDKETATGKTKEEAIMLFVLPASLPAHAAAAHLAHGRLLVGERDYAAAVEHLEKSHELDPLESVATYLEAVRELQ
jgi:Flp pilus assembly protein TadD